MKIRVIFGILTIFCVSSVFHGCASTGNLGIISKTTGDPGSLFTSPHPRSRLASAVVDDKIYAIGGRENMDPAAVSAIVEQYDPSLDQ